jgi:hypothetical protein
LKFLVYTPVTLTINALSETPDAGFANVTTPADTHPFNSGDKCDYDVQSALTASTTYYWRVRGKDPAGSNTYGAWSTPTRSFTVSGTPVTRRRNFPLWI